MIGLGFGAEGTTPMETGIVYIDPSVINSHFLII
jgi:hypothetical protein